MRAGAQATPIGGGGADGEAVLSVQPAGRAAVVFHIAFPCGSRSPNSSLLTSQRCFGILLS